MSEHLPGAEHAAGVLEDVATPRMFKVLMHNDDYTTMEFVVEVLTSVFRRPEAEAIRVMLAIHHRGVGVAGVYPAQVAETKIAEVHRRAEAQGFPLRCSMEPE